MSTSLQPNVAKALAGDGKIVLGREQRD